MSLELQALRAKIESAAKLLGVVETMRGLAAVNIRRAESVVDQVDEYARVVRVGLRHAVRALDAESDGGALGAQGDKANAPVTAVVISSDQGLCGQFNDRICEYAKRLFRSESGGPLAELIVVGLRGLERLSDLREQVVAQIGAPSSIEGIPIAVRETRRALEPYLLGDAPRRVVVIHNRLQQGMAFVERHHALAPFDAERWRALPAGESPQRMEPSFSVPAERLVSHFVREQFVIDLFQAFAQSFAAENAARLASMQGAAESIEDRLASLEGAYRDARQEAITSELMDLLAGVEAVSPPTSQG